MRCGLLTQTTSTPTGTALMTRLPQRYAERGEEGERRERGGREEGERRERGGERGGKGEIGIGKKGDDRINGGFLGYGDAFGTATITSDPAWIVNMDHSEIAFNTQVYSLHFHLFPLPSPSLSPPLSPNLLYINRTVLTRCILLALTPKVEYHNSYWY